MDLLTFSTPIANNTSIEHYWQNPFSSTIAHKELMVGNLTQVEITVTQSEAVVRLSLGPRLVHFYMVNIVNLKILDFSL